MLRALSGGSFSILLHAINNCWSTNFIPSDLRCIKIVPIPKPGSVVNKNFEFSTLTFKKEFISRLADIWVRKLTTTLESIVGRLFGKKIFLPFFYKSN
ncbi:uncharacterized protein ACN427_004646 isoform 5-T8 [Glossina fuscipes fuscipes]